MRLELSPAIAQDLEDIGDWIAQDSPDRAVTFVQQIRDEFGRIGKNPLLFQLRPEIAEDARLSIVGRYVILFWTDGNVVKIERVVFGGRDLTRLLQ